MQNNSTSYRVRGARGIFTLRHADGKGGYSLEDARKIIAAFLIVKLIDNRPGFLDEIKERHQSIQNMDELLCAVADGIAVRETRVMPFLKQAMQRVRLLLFCIGHKFTNYHQDPEDTPGATQGAGR